jgi:phage RecT family recombinase
MKETASSGRPATPVELYAAQVIGDEASAAELFRVLPDHIPPERFRRNLLNLLMQKPELLKYEPRLVYREVSKAAALGLLLDPQLGEAYILPAWNGRTKREEPELRAGYRGIIKLARQSGEVANVYAHEVHEHDFIDCDLGVDKRLVHKPNLFGERGQVIGYYAVVKYRDGSSDFEPMTLQQVHIIRDRSDSWCAFKAGKLASTPWATDEEEMGKKTAIKRLLKRVAQSPDLASALGFDDDAVVQETNVVHINQAARRREGRSISARLDSFANPDGAASPIAPEAADSPMGQGSGSPGEAEDLKARPDHALSKPLLNAMERGRTARRKGQARKPPKALGAKKRAKEAEAFLRGWDEEQFALRAEQFGSL